MQLGIPILLAVTVLLAAYPGSGLQCLDESGSSVDWFVMYKLPKVTHDSRALVREGHAYMYLDSNNQLFTLSPNNISDTQGAVFNTLNQVYTSSSSNIGYGFYNDEQPNGKSSDYRGHTKGAIGIDSAGTSFWLIHSVPRFPNYVEDGYAFPESGFTNGQSFLCISTTTTQMDTVGVQFLYTYPYSYSVNISVAVFGSELPNLVDSLVDGEHVTKPPYNDTLHITSLEGMEFTLYSKYKDAVWDIVSVQLAEGCGSSLKSETWQNGINPLPSNCSGAPYNVQDVKSIKFESQGIEFSETKDHSKWAVAYDKDWTCIGDLNRQSSQMSRCGGYACFVSVPVNRQYRALVNSTEPCPAAISGGL